MQILGNGPNTVSESTNSNAELNELFLVVTKFRGESSVSSSQPIIYVPMYTHRVFRRTHRVWCRTHSVISSETVSVDRKRGQRKGAASKNVKNPQKCQKYFRHFSTFFVQRKKRQKWSKSVKNNVDTFRQFSRGTSFLAPFGGIPPVSQIPAKPPSKRKIPHAVSDPVLSLPFLPHQKQKC